MRIFQILLIFCLTTFACNPAQDNDFQRLYENFQQTIDEEPLLRVFLEKQVALDSVLIIPKEKEVQRILALCKNQLEDLHKIELERIDVSLHEHYTNTHSFLDIIIKNIEDEKIHTTNPYFYDPLSYLQFLNTTNNLSTLNQGLDLVVLNFRIAIKNLNPTEAQKLETGVSKSIETFDFLSNNTLSKIKGFKAEKRKEKEALIKLTRAKLEVKNFIAFCNSKLFDLGNDDIVIEN